MSIKEKGLDEKPKKKSILPKKYEKPVVHSQDLLAFAAVCNGTTAGNRKASVGNPNFCRSNRLNS